MCLTCLEKWKRKDGALGNGLPPFCVMSMDWEQVQWCPFWFLRNKLGLFLEGVPDYTHVRNVNHTHATVAAGETLTITKAHICNNVRKGPWHGKTWGGDLREAAYCISTNVKANSPFFLVFWPKIKTELKLGADYDGEAGRAKFLLELPALALVDRDPPTSSPQRWMTFQTCSDFLDPYCEVDRMLLSFTAIRKGWVETLDELMLWPTWNHHRTINFNERYSKQNKLNVVTICH